MGVEMPAMRPLVLAVVVAVGVVAATSTTPAAAAPVWERVLPYPPAVAAAVRERAAARAGLRDLPVTTVFLNFEGATIHNGQDSNAATDTTWIAFTHGDCALRESVTIPRFDETYWAAQGPRAQVIETIAALVADVYAGYQVRFVTTRPASGHYTMTVVGGTCESAATLCQDRGVVGVSPVDCADEETLNLNPDDINFVCSDSLGGLSLDLPTVANIIAHEDAHTFGLAHIDRHEDIMYYAPGPGARSWGQGTVQADATSCSATGFQDDGAYLTRALGGPAAPDETPGRGCQAAPSAPRGLALLGVLALLARRGRRRGHR
jgi:hypothetical protein